MNQDPTSAINTGDTAFLLISAALVMLMTPGLAFFYGGMVRGKNVLGTMMQSFVAVAIVSVQWVLWGYTLSFRAGPRRPDRRPRLARSPRRRRGAQCRLRRRPSRIRPS